MRIHDLSGTLLRTLFVGEQGGGSFAAEWDGRDEAGQMAPPGVYLYRVDLDTDTKREAEVGVVEVVY